MTPAELTRMLEGQRIGTPEWHRLKAKAAAAERQKARALWIALARQPDAEAGSAWSIVLVERAPKLPASTSVATVRCSGTIESNTYIMNELLQPGVESRGGESRSLTCWLRGYGRRRRMAMTSASVTRSSGCRPNARHMSWQKCCTCVGAASVALPHKSPRTACRDLESLLTYC